MIIYFEAKQSITSRIAGKIYLLKWPSVVLNLQVRRNMYLEKQNKIWVKLFRGYHSHFTSNSRPYTEYECSVNVQALRVFTPKWRKMQASSTLIIVLICLCILETLTCTLLPDNQDWQVTHVGRFRNCSVHLEADWERVLWFPFDRRGCGKWTYQGNPRAINSSSTSLRPFSSPGTLPGSCHCPGWSGSRQRPCFFTNETMIMTQVFLEEMEGCHLFLSPPFVMHSGIRGCTKTFRRAAKMASRWSCRRVSESPRDWTRRFTFPLFPVVGFRPGTSKAVPSRRAHNRSSFSWLFSRVHLAAARSRMALKRSSLSLELSLPACGELRGALPSALLLSIYLSESIT